MKENKIEYFEVFVHEMYELKNNGNKNDLSLLKLMKLLFFVTAIDSNKKSDNILIKSVFDNFVAMPFGHVESEIYDILKSNNELKFYTIDYYNTERKENFSKYEFEKFKSSLETSKVNAIFKAIETLKLINKNLINFSAFELVELSHQWYSWRKNYQDAVEQNFFSKPIPKEEIIEEDKYFNLQIV